MADTTSCTPTYPVIPGAAYFNPPATRLNMEELPRSQKPGPRMMEGFTITACNPSSIQRHTSISDRNLDSEYPVLVLVCDQINDSVAGDPSGDLPMAEVEETCSSF